MIETSYTRPDWKKMPERHIQRDITELCDRTGSMAGSQLVCALPSIAVQSMEMKIPEGIEKVSKIENVPAALGILDIDCDGEVSWNVHGHNFPLGGRKQMLIYLSRPEDGFSQFFKTDTSLRIKGAYASMEKIRKLAEDYPNSFGTLCEKIDQFHGDDCVIDMSETMNSPILQNCMAVMCTAPLLGNSSEEFLYDNISTYVSSLSEGILSSSIQKARYDAELRSKIYQAREIICANLSKPLSLRDLSRAVGTNENYLKAGFKHEFGTTVFGYLFECRMLTARQMLLETSLPVEQIARAVGYTDPSAIFAPFRLRFGVTPKQFRNLPITICHIHK